MPNAKTAREWAADGGLRGIGNSLYTPFCGKDGDDIDYDAFRWLVAYCTRDLGHPMLWLTSGIAEWWSLTIDERKKLVEVAIDETRKVAPDTVIQVCTSSSTAKDALELTRHAQASGADICYIQTPPMECHAGEGVQRFFQYIADRTDIALGMFDSPSSGYVMTPGEIAKIYEAIPAVVAIKEGDCVPGRARMIHNLVPNLLVWEPDDLAYRSGWLQQGVVCAPQIGTAAYLYETPDDRRYSTFWELIWEGKLADAIEHARLWVDPLRFEMGSWTTVYPGRTGYFTHWGEAYRYISSVIGMKTGAYPHSRPPQGIMPDSAKTQIRTAYEKYGLAGKLTPDALPEKALVGA